MCVSWVMQKIDRHRFLARLALLSSCCGLTLPATAQGTLGSFDAMADARQPANAQLERCVQAEDQAERYATFAGRMIALPGSTGMAMRIDIQERTPGEISFHRVEGPGVSGLGSWRDAEAGVKIFKDVKQVTNLGAPLEYRAIVRFRWTAPKGVVVKRELLRTPVCREFAPEGGVGGEASTARMPAR